MRQIVLDTETTGLEPSEGHRIIEIGCYELIQRRPTGRTFHEYLNPGRPVAEGAVEIHGLTDAFLADKPRFADVAQGLVEFVADAEVIIHNAPFDTGFLDHEFGRLGEAWGRFDDHCRVTDTLIIARRRHPGQRNSLDALCKRYGIDNTERTLHGALLDAEILAEVYLAMTGGQGSLHLGAEDSGNATLGGIETMRPVTAERARLPVIQPDSQAMAAHQAWLDRLDQTSGSACIWRSLPAQKESV
ncbi:MAG: DNA polymerase III subunit epsilon [Spiribacter sp.]|jgi:DNA polymerase-3 subunit epsilon|nr:DNA polymerase III subunit epsilon [Spiribacter sp.]MDR9488975.1 DNA polymerase III subunit epsilon [Spiribacter sp.]